MTGLEISVVIGVMAAGSFIQGSVGFGLNLVAAPVLVLVDPRFVPGPALVGAVALTLLVSWRDRAGIDGRAVATTMVGRVPGTVLAALTVAALPERGMAVVFAVLVLASVAILAWGRRVPLRRRTMIGAGAVSGYMGTATSIGGPPMALIFAGEDGPVLRGTLSAIFVIGSGFSTLALVVAGDLTGDDVGRTLLLLPGIVVGFAVSKWGARHLDRGRTRPAVLAVSALAAAAVLFTAVT